MRGALERARTFAVGLGNALEGERTPNGRRFAALEGSATATVGLTAALWVERVAARERRAYERRIHGPIRTLTGQRIAGLARVYLPATFHTSLQLPAGVDVSGSRRSAPRCATPRRSSRGPRRRAPRFAGRRGFFLVQAARFGRGPGSTGFLVVFVPSGWLGLSVDEDVRRLAISLDGRRLEGGLATAPDASKSFVDLTRRWRVDVAREPATASAGDAAMARPGVAGGDGAPRLSGRSRRSCGDAAPSAKSTTSSISPSTCCAWRASTATSNG